MNPKIYAEAFDAALLGGLSPEVASQNLVRVATARGHKHLLPAILRACEARMKKKEEATTVSVTSATPLSEEELAFELDRAGFAHHNTRVIRQVDESLVSGSIVRKGSMRVDVSGKRLLLNIYHKLIA
jgi:F0F1-type ATP synthase delta subunit